MEHIGPYLSLITLVFLILNFAFNRGDKSAGKVEALAALWAAKHDTAAQSIHALELAQRDMEARIHGRVGDRYATKDDIQRLTDKVGDMAEAQRQYHESLQAILRPLADQLVVGTVRR